MRHLARYPVDGRLERRAIQGTVDARTMAGRFSSSFRSASLFCRMRMKGPETLNHPYRQIGRHRRRRSWRSDPASPGPRSRSRSSGLRFTPGGLRAREYHDQKPCHARERCSTAASCGKQFTGLGIVMLAAEGKLRYDDHISRHIPELAEFPPNVTIRNLLYRVSGVSELLPSRGSRRRAAVLRRAAGE